LEGGATVHNAFLDRSFRAVTASPITYDPATDTMLIELRPWPGGSPAASEAGGEDAG
jgi:hypothetical protein